MQTEKPLFIPLKTQWFVAFERGLKCVEYRAYGPRWNERTCRIGRKAVLSHGYSGRRMTKTVEDFEMLPRLMAPETAQEIFPDAGYIAAIWLK